MKKERIEGLLEAINAYIEHIAHDYAEGLKGLTEKETIKDWYIEEAIRIDLEMPSMQTLPDFFDDIVEKVKERVAQLMEEAGYDTEWYADDLIVYPLEEEN